MHTSDIQLPGAGRRRGRYSDEFKRKVIAACEQPGVSTAAVALANGLNANLLRRWISQSRLPEQPSSAKRAKTVAVQAQTQFVPLELAAHGAPAHIQIELRHGCAVVRVQWPLTGAGQCAAWMREVLK